MGDPYWMSGDPIANGETDEEEVLEDDPDVLHDRMKEDKE